MDSQAKDIPIDLREKLLSYWRGRKSFYLVAGTALLSTLLIALLWPPTYQSVGTILIEQQEIPQEMVRSVITSFADQRVQIIGQRVMTTQNLLSIIERYNLYPDVRDKEPREVLLERMRNDIGMHMISADVIDPRSGRPTQATIAFSVSYRSRSADLALKVASELTTLYLNENLTSRQQSTQQTATFFAEEARREAVKIAALDQTLSEFKKAHHDDLPELAQYNEQSLERTAQELHDADNRLHALAQQRVLLEAQLTQVSPHSVIYSDTGQKVFSPEDRLKTLRSQLASYKAKYAPGHPDILSTQREVDGLEKEVKLENSGGDRLRYLSEAKAKLASAQEKYSADHPDVVRLQHEVDALEKAAAADAAAGTKAIAINDAHADNPVYIQLKSELDALAVETESAEKQRAERAAKLADYEKRLDHSPEIERQYRTMARELDSVQMKYMEILAKQTEAQVSQNMEIERKGEKFTLIEPPQPPEKPVSPNRFMILGVGILMSLALGVGAVVLREAVEATIRGPTDIRQVLSVPALASIPVIVTTDERRRYRRVRNYSLTGGLAVVIVTAVILHFFYRPLDVLWVILLHRFGA